MQKNEIINRIIPLPRSIKVAKGVSYEASRIKIELPGEKTPPLKTASNILKRFANPGQICPDFTISLKYINKDRDKSSYKKLKGIKNRDQAYTIKSNVNKGVYESIDIMAFTDIGLLYGTLTFSQAVIKNGTEIYIPVLEVADWPEIPFRGQWGGNSHDDMNWTFQYKLNAIDGKVFANTDSEGNPVIDHDQKLYDEAEGLGINIMTTISHLESLSKKGFFKSNIDVFNVPSPERGGRSDYFPGLCMSKKTTEDMLYEWIEGLAGEKSVKNILVWLSEEPTPCYCDKCNGAEPYQLETACLLRVYDRLKQKYPETGFEVMLSQGSFGVTEKISNMLPDDVALTYYDGGRTYDSGKYPMVLPELKRYVKKGGELGIYPQVTHSWRTVFPWTAPEFIKYRCDEFEKIGLKRVIGYAVPSNRYHEFNLMAFAEWLWNPKGRKSKEFSAVYAGLNEMDPESFVRYLKLMEKPAWQLAESKLLLRLTYNYSLVLRGRVELQDHRYEMSELVAIKNPDKLIVAAKKALDIARDMDESSLIYEAKCVISSLRAYKCITGFIKELDKKTINTEKLRKYYRELKKAAETVRRSIMRWSGEMIPSGSIPVKRVIDTSMVLYRALDGFRRYFDETYVVIEDNSGTVNPLGEWDESNFDKTGRGILEYDVTDFLVENGKGEYYISLDFVESASGTDIDKIMIDEKQPGGGNKTIAIVHADLSRLSVWSPWIEYPVKITKINPVCEYSLCIDISGIEKGAETCRGLSGIRKV